MIFSAFGTKLTTKSGILQLMDDLGKPLPKGSPSYQLGGGNPARISGVEQAYRREMEQLLAEGDRFENAIARYDAPQGRASFIEAIADFLSKTYGWNLSPQHIAITNGSQTAMFYLLNLFSGTFSDSNEKDSPHISPTIKSHQKAILFPLVPEYIGYADQGIEKNTLVSLPSQITYYDDHTFKYFINFTLLENYLAEHNSGEGNKTPIGALCVSRPTNPSGNVLTDTEIQHLAKLAKQYTIPLLIDNAYGLPFPHIVFTDDAHPIWNENIVLSMSLSKIGLPSLRTGIVVASPQIATAISNLNAIAALSTGSLGQVLAEGMIKSGEIVSLAQNCVKPFYEKKSHHMQKWIHQYFRGTEYAIHRSEGSIFIWLYLPALKISTKDLYIELKKYGLITVPGEYFFFGHTDQLENEDYPHPHYDKCLRLNYSRPADEEEEAVKIIADVYRQFC